MMEKAKPKAITTLFAVEASLIEPDGWPPTADRRAFCVSAHL